MATESRTGVLGGQDITLRVLMLDDRGFPRDSDSLPDVYIYDPNVDGTTIQEEIDAATFTSAYAGPFVPTKIGTGYYEYTYSVPSGAEEGSWSDVWVGALDTVAVGSYKTFAVTAGGTFTVQKLYENRIVIIEMAETIATLADSTKTLEAPITWSFMTVMNPFYASTDLVRMEAGPIIEYIPDDTLALMIHWASLEADSISPRKRCNDRYEFWRTKFVIVDTALKALTLPGGAYLHGLNAGVGGSKTLGELSIKKGNIGPTDVMSGGIDKDTYDKLKEMRDEIWRVVNAGGCINPGQSLGFTGALRGILDPARRKMGRQWVSPDEYWYQQPTSNTKIRREGERMYRMGQTSWRPRHGSVPWSRRFTGSSYRGRYYFD